VLYSEFSIFILINAIYYQFSPVNMVVGPTYAGRPSPRGPTTPHLFHVGPPPSPPLGGDNFSKKKVWKHGLKPKTFKLRYILLTTKLHFYLCLYSIFSIFIVIIAIHYQFSPISMVVGPTPTDCTPPRGPTTLAPPPRGPTTSTPIGCR
jgi:hypothetical protein